VLAAVLGIREVRSDDSAGVVVVHQSDFGEHSSCKIPNELRPDDVGSASRP